MGAEMTPAETIVQRYLALGGQREGAGWLALLWEAVQALDDWRDGDPVAPMQIEQAIHIVLHDLPAHPFFRRHAAYLLPHLSALVLKWRGANAIEAQRDREQYPKAFMWRAGYYDLVLMALALEAGPEHAGRMAAEVATLYGETIEEFTRETNDA